MYVSIVSIVTSNNFCVCSTYIRTYLFNLQGLVKPDIVFFGEDLPSRFHTLQRKDFMMCDLLIVMGTSLEVSSNHTTVLH